MCGIAGILRADGAPVAETVAAMIDALAHRGPDGEGAFTIPGAGLGHRRLAIIDPASGRQPLGNEDGQVQVVCNGEIYNYRELRTELLARGHRFATATDSETIVHGYEEWGDACVEHFRGMFAFAVLDLRRRRLLLARDHLGIKPLVYLARDGVFAFASELAALRCVPGATWRADRSAIDLFLRLQYIPAPFTAYAGICKLPPAHRLVVDLDGQAGEPERYWDVAFAPDHRRTPGEWAEAALAVVTDSVRAHLVSDVPFGAFLSGGVDSSAVVALMARHLGAPVRTFTIGFTDADCDERPWARQVAARWGTEHHEAVIAPDVFAVLPDLVRRYGEPFGDSSAIPTWHLARLARGTVPMVLSGDGGDEAFGGYDTYRDWQRWLTGLGQPAWRLALRRLAALIAPSRWPPRAPTPANWVRFVQCLGDHQRRRLWRPEQDPGGGILPAAFAPTDAAGLPPLSLAQRLDLGTYLPGDILTKVDIASMAHGLEVRTPLVDRMVVEFAATIPADLNPRDAQGGWRSKALFKDALIRAGLYDRAFLDRPKQGFAMPMARWLAPHGPLRHQAEERLLAAQSPLTAWFRPAAIRQLLAQGRHGPVWLLLVLDEWLRQHPEAA